MVIQIYKSIERKGEQQWQMVYDCRNDWYMLNKADYQFYQDIMNMKTSRYNGEHGCYVALTYHIKLNKW